MTGDEYLLSRATRNAIKETLGKKIDEDPLSVSEKATEILGREKPSVKNLIRFLSAVAGEESSKEIEDNIMVALRNKLANPSTSLTLTARVEDAYVLLGLLGLSREEAARHAFRTETYILYTPDNKDIVDGLTGGGLRNARRIMVESNSGSLIAVIYRVSNVPLLAVSEIRKAIKAALTPRPMKVIEVTSTYPLKMEEKDSEEPRGFVYLTLALTDDFKEFAEKTKEFIEEFESKLGEVMQAH